MSQHISHTIGKGTFWFSSSGIALKVVSLTSTFFILSNLSVYEYGLVVLVLSIVPIFSIFLLPGLGDVVIADMGLEKSRNNLGKMKAIFNNYIAIQFLLAFMAWVIVFFGADIIAEFYKGQVGLLLKILSFSFFLSPFRSALGALFNVYLKFFSQSLYIFLEEFFKLGFLIFFFFVLKLSTDGVILATVLSQTLALLVLAPFCLQVYKSFSHAKAEPMPLFSSIHFHGKWSVLTSYLATFGKKGRLWIIKFMLGTEVVGLYAVAEGLFGHASSFVPINKVITPILPQYVDQKERFRKIILKSIKYQVTSYVLIGVVAFLGIPYLISLVFPNYISSIILSQVILIALLPTGVAVVLNPVFFALKAQKQLFITTVARVIVMLILTPIFILLFGIMGVIYELILTTVFVMFIRYYSLKKLLPTLAFNLKEFFSIDADDYMIFNTLAQPIKRFFTTMGGNNNLQQ
ncbi:oligosaccharide flippase family protein [Candidatus Kaiserbacteria bacterium]|nr:oligosaccharide flippase family protein [Candidatus Kaiserbacteria bacterium]